MADENDTDDNASTPDEPTDEQKTVETPNDPVEPDGGDNKPESDNVTEGMEQRLDRLEKELSSLKAMLDTLGFEEPATPDEPDEPDDHSETIEDLF